MNKQKTLALIPLAIVAGLLIYTWSIILFTDIIAVWRHYVGLLLFLPLPYLLFKSFKIGLLATGIYLILGTFNLFSITPSIDTTIFSLKIGSMELSTPSLQLLLLGLLILYCIVNFNSFVTIYVDYKVRDDESQSL